MSELYEYFSNINGFRLNIINITDFYLKIPCNMLSTQHQHIRCLFLENVQLFHL